MVPAFASTTKNSILLGEKPRVEPRTKALIKARLRDCGPERDVCILDLSTRGILATAARPPARGNFVEFLVGNHTLVGQVKWASERRFGIVLRDRVSVSALLSGDHKDIALSASPFAKKRTGSIIEAFADNNRSLDRFVQLALVILIIGTGAYVLADFVATGLSPIAEAEMALNKHNSD